jgi:hypothetical protein
MAFSAGLLAQYIRGLGYGAIPCGNDTAWLNKWFLWGDDIFGYGKKGDANKFW